jgi:hypothetical protein
MFGDCHWIHHKNCTLASVFKKALFSLSKKRRICSEVRKATSEEDNRKNLNKILYFLLISPTLRKRGKDTFFEGLC